MFHKLEIPFLGLTVSKNLPFGIFTDSCQSLKDSPNLTNLENEILQISTDLTQEISEDIPQVKSEDLDEVNIYFVLILDFATNHF